MIDDRFGCGQYSWILCRGYGLANSGASSITKAAGEVFAVEKIPNFQVGVSNGIGNPIKKLSTSAADTGG